MTMDKETALECLNFGLIAFSDKQYQKAVSYFTLAIESDSFCTEAYIGRAETYEQTGKFRKAIKDLNKIISLEPDNFKLSAFLASLYLKIGENKKATEIIKSLLPYCVTSKLTIQQKYHILTYLHELQEVSNLLRLELSKHPTDESLWMTEGNVLATRGYWQEAIYSYNQAISILKLKDMKREVSVCYFYIGNCFVKQKCWSTAVKAFHNAIELQPKNSLYLLWYGIVLIKLKNDKAINVINKSLKINPFLYKAYLLRAYYYEDQNRISKAILNCNEAIKCNNTSAESYMYRGILKHKMKSDAFAFNDFNSAHELDPLNPYILLNRAIFFEDVNSYDLAIKDYSIALENCEIMDELRLKLLIRRSFLFMKLKEFRLAMVDLLKYLHDQPSDKHAIWHLAFVQYKCGLRTEALESLKHCFLIDGNFEGAFILRGSIFFEDMHRDISLIIKDYEKAVYLKPLNAIGWLNLSIALVSMNKYQLSWNILTKIIIFTPSESSAYQMRSLINLRMGNYLAALTDINSALRLETNSSLLINRAIIHKMMRDKVSAIKDLKKALDIDISNSLASYYIGNLYADNHQYSQALEYYDKAVLLKPRHCPLLINRSIVKAELQDFIGAMADLEQAELLSNGIENIQYFKNKFTLMQNKKKSIKI